MATPAPGSREGERHANLSPIPPSLYNGRNEDSVFPSDEVDLMGDPTGRDCNLVGSIAALQSAFRGPPRRPRCPGCVSS